MVERARLGPNLITFVQINISISILFYFHTIKTDHILYQKNKNRPYISRDGKMDRVCRVKKIQKIEDLDIQI